MKIEDAYKLSYPNKIKFIEFLASKWPKTIIDNLLALNNADNSGRNILELYMVEVSLKKHKLTGYDLELWNKIITTIINSNVDKYLIQGDIDLNFHIHHYL